jgi:putative ABC transport system permease protein
MAGLGVTAGAALAFTIARLARGILFGVSPHDSITYVGIAAVLLGSAAAAAAYVPARRATALDPLAALRA